MINEKAGRNGDKVLSQAKPKTFMDIFRNPDLLNAFITDQCSSDPSEDQHFFEGYTTVNGVYPSNICVGETNASEDIGKQNADNTESKQSEKCGVDVTNGNGANKSAIAVSQPSSGYEQRQPSVFIMQQNVNVNSRNMMMSSNVKNPPSSSAKYVASPTSPSTHQQPGLQLPSRQYNTLYGHGQRGRVASNDVGKCPTALATRVGNSEGSSVSADGNTTVLSQMIGAQTNINVIVNQTIFDRHQKGDKTLPSSDNRRSLSIPIDSPLSIEPSGVPAMSALAAKQQDKTKSGMDGDRNDTGIRPTLKSKKSVNRNVSKAVVYPQECVSVKAEPAGNVFKNQVIAKQQRRSRSSQLTLQHLIGSNEDQPNTLSHIGGVVHYGFQKPVQSLKAANDLSAVDYNAASNAMLGNAFNSMRPMIPASDCDPLMARSMNQSDAISQRVRMLQQFRQRSALLQLRQQETTGLSGMVDTPQNVIIADPAMPQLTLAQLKVLQPSSGWGEPLDQQNKTSNRMYVQQAQRMKNEPEKPRAYHQSQHPDAFLSGQTSNRIFVTGEKQTIPSMQVLMPLLQQDSRDQSPNYKRIALPNAESQFGPTSDFGTHGVVHQDSSGLTRPVQRQTSSMLGSQMDALRNNDSFQLEGLHQQQVDGYAMQRQQNQFTKKWECNSPLVNNLTGMIQQPSMTAGSRDVAALQRRLVVQQSPVSSTQTAGQRCYSREECQQMLKQSQQFNAPIMRVQPNQRPPYQVLLEKQQVSTMPAQNYTAQLFNRQLLRTSAVEQLASQQMRPRIISSAHNNQQVFYCPVAISSDVYNKNPPSSYSPVQQATQGPLLMPAFVDDENWSHPVQVVETGQMTGQQDDRLRAESGVATRHPSGKRSAPNVAGPKGNNSVGGPAKRQRRAKGSRNAACASPLQVSRQTERKTPVSSSSSDRYMPNLLMQHASNTIGSNCAQPTTQPAGTPMSPVDLLKQKIFQRVAQLNILQQQGYDVTGLFADLRNKAAEAFARLNASVGSQQTDTSQKSVAQGGVNGMGGTLNGRADQSSQIALTPAARHSLSLLPPEQQQQVMITLRKQQLQHNQMKLAELTALRTAHSAVPAGYNQNAFTSDDGAMQDIAPSSVAQMQPRYSEQPYDDRRLRSGSPQQVVDCPDGSRVHKNGLPTMNAYQQLRQYYHAQLPSKDDQEAMTSQSGMVLQGRAIKCSTTHLNSTDDMLVSKHQSGGQTATMDNRLSANDEQSLGSALTVDKKRTDAVSLPLSTAQKPPSDGEGGKSSLSQHLDGEYGDQSNQRVGVTRESPKGQPSRPNDATEPAKSDEYSREGSTEEKASKDLSAVSRKHDRLGADFGAACNDGSRPPPGLMGSPYATPIQRIDGTTLWLSVGPLPINDKKTYSKAARRSRANSPLSDEADRIDYDSILKDLNSFEKQPFPSLISRDGSLSAEQKEFRRKLSRIDRLLSSRPTSYSPESARDIAAKVILGIGCRPVMAHVPSPSKEEIMKIQVQEEIQHLKNLALRSKARKQAREAEKEREETRRRLATECETRRQNPDLQTPFKDTQDLKERLHCYVAPYESDDNDFNYDVSAYPPLSSLDLQQRMMNVKQTFARSRRRHFKRLNAPLPHTDAVDVIRSQINLERHGLEATIKSNVPPERPIRIEGKPEPLPAHLNSLQNVIKMPKRVKVNGKFVFNFDESDNWRKYFGPLPSRNTSGRKSRKEIVRHLCDGL